jgi:predicted nucleic-acid-binding Zn-ribbon protein
VDWDEKYYLITCTTCGKSEAYNEVGEKIEINEEREVIVN